MTLQEIVELCTKEDLDKPLQMVIAGDRLTIKSEVLKAVIFDEEIHLIGYTNKNLTEVT